MKNQEKKPNKLIIIGNGFDRAHDMPTDYKDFLLWLIRGEIKEFMKNRHLSEYIHFDKQKIYNEVLLTYTLNEYLNLFEINKEEAPFFYLDDYSPKRELSIKNLLLLKILKQIHLQNWVNIEKIFYDSLTEIFNKRIKNKEDSVDIYSLNHEFNLIKYGLVEYLNTIPEPEKKSNITNEIYAITKSNIEYLDSNEYNPQAIKPVFVLNFNYTNTPNKYFPYHEVCEFVNIHGQLNSSENPIIFGYGNEYDEKYTEIEQSGLDEYLENFKSFQYLQTDNYAKLEAFVEAGDFEIYIMGHSCGQSDRTLLKYLFENKNCKKIYIRYKDSTDYYAKTKEIARAFSDKISFRSKVANIAHKKVGPLGG